MLNLSNKSSFFFECLPSYENGYLKVGNNHSIYFEQYGNPKGIPILFLHGGPGAGFSNAHKSFFDPKIFRVVFLIREDLVKVYLMLKQILIIHNF